MEKTSRKNGMKQMAASLILLAGSLLAGSAGLAQVPGCTDPGAVNYDSSATVNDGSCTYGPVHLHPKWSLPLSGDIAETSGLVLWDNRLVTHNDNTDTRLYLLDTASAEVAGTITLEGVENVDWEDVAQDGAYFYVGDFGNNASGSRTDLRILRISKSSLETGPQQIDTIAFAYADQGEPEPAGGNATDYDCEALVVMGDSLCLFTKQWVSGNSSVYFLPKVPGSYQVSPALSLPVEGMITGATHVESSGAVVLLGYNILLQPFFYLLYDYTGNDFLTGNRRKVFVELTFYQTEGITSGDGLHFYVSNEKFTSAYASTSQQLHLFHLGELLGGGSTGSAPREPDANRGAPCISQSIRGNGCHQVGRGTGRIPFQDRRSGGEKRPPGHADRGGYHG